RRKAVNMANSTRSWVIDSMSFSVLFTAIASMSVHRAATAWNCSALPSSSFSYSPRGSASWCRGLATSFLIATMMVRRIEMRPKRPNAAIATSAVMHFSMRGESPRASALALLPVRTPDREQGASESGLSVRGTDIHDERGRVGRYSGHATPDRVLDLIEEVRASRGCVLGHDGSRRGRARNGDLAHDERGGAGRVGRHGRQAVDDDVAHIVDEAAVGAEELVHGEALVGRRGDQASGLAHDVAFERAGEVHLGDLTGQERSGADVPHDADFAAAARTVDVRADGAVAEVVVLDRILLAFQVRTGRNVDRRRVPTEVGLPQREGHVLVACH